MSRWNQSNMYTVEIGKSQTKTLLPWSVITTDHVLEFLQNSGQYVCHNSQCKLLTWTSSKPTI